MEIAVVLLLLVLVLGGQVLLFSKYLFRNFRYRCSFDRQEVFEGEQIQMVETVLNGKALPIPYLRADIVTSRFLEFADTESSLTDETRFVPVSYTHLDVYKRQGLSSHGRRPALPGVDPLLEKMGGAGFLSFCLVCLRKGYKNAASHGLAGEKRSSRKRSCSVMTKRNQSLLRLVQMAILSAIIVIMGFTVLGSIPLGGPLVATIAQVPVDVYKRQALSQALEQSDLVVLTGALDLPMMT